MASPPLLPSSLPQPASLWRRRRSVIRSTDDVCNFRVLHRIHQESMNGTQHESITLPSPLGHVLITNCDFLTSVRCTRFGDGRQFVSLCPGGHFQTVFVSMDQESGIGMGELRSSASGGSGRFPLARYVSVRLFMKWARILSGSVIRSCYFTVTTGYAFHELPK